MAGKCTGALAVGAPGTTLVTLRADDRHYDGTDRIVICAQIDAPRDRVWRALTEEEQILEWWGSYVSLDARLGGRLTERWTDASGARITSN